MAKRTQHKTKYYYSPQGYDADIKPGESEEHYFKRVMWAADKRLERLEKLSRQKGYEHVLDYAYKTAMADIKIYTGEGKKRFGQSVPEVTSIRSEKVAAALHFLGSATSTRQGIKQVYQKRAETISKISGVTITWNELADVADAMNAEESGGSPSKLKAIGIITTINKEGIEKALKKNKHMKDEVLMELVKKYLTSDKSKDLRSILNISEADATDMFYQIKAKEISEKDDIVYETVYEQLKSGERKI